MSKQLQCPKCQSYRVLQDSKTGKVCIVAGLVTAIFGFGIILILLGLALLLSKRCKCQQCGFTFKK